MAAKRNNNSKDSSANGDFKYAEDEKDFMFTEYEAFETLLGMTRDQNREIYKQNIKYLPVKGANGSAWKKTETNRNHFRSHLPDTQLSNSAVWVKESSKKEKEAVTRTYHDFLLSRHNFAKNERSREIRSAIAKDDQELSSNYPDLTRKRNNNLKCNRNHSLGGRNFFDKTISYLMEDSNF